MTRQQPKARQAASGLWSPRPYNEILCQENPPYTWINPRRGLRGHWKIVPTDKRFVIKIKSYSYCCGDDCSLCNKRQKIILETLSHSTLGFWWYLRQSISCAVGKNPATRFPRICLMFKKKCEPDDVFLFFFRQEKIQFIRIKWSSYSVNFSRVTWISPSRFVTPRPDSFQRLLQRLIIIKS